jgi:hypothetical protein
MNLVLLLLLMLLLLPLLPMLPLFLRQKLLVLSFSLQQLFSRDNRLVPGMHAVVSEAVGKQISLEPW